MPDDIAFLHTSPVHVPTFDALMREVAPALHAVHRVHEGLLADAQREGTQSAALVARVHAALTEAAAGGAAVVVCTCSTIGGIAEALDGEAPFRTTRIDRAMADQAVRRGGKVLLVAALPSTVAPTTALLLSSCRRLGVAVEVEPLVVASAWAHFEGGRQAEYLDAIVAAVAPRASGADAVVLAQASMARAAPLLSARGIEALTSPRLGVEHAVSVYRQCRSS